MTKHPEINIIDCGADQAGQWNQYVQMHADASFYHLYEWKNIHSGHFKHKTYNLAALRDGVIAGVFPLVHIKSRLFGSIMCSLPFLNFGGPCADDNRIEKKLLQAAADIAKREGADYIEIRSTKILDESLPTATHKTSMTLALQSDPDILWNAFASKHRTNIRRVYKDDISVRHGHGDVLDDFYHVLAHSWRHLGTPIYSKRYFNAILEAFPEKTRIFVCYQHGKIPIAAAFNGYFKSTVEGMWAGALAESRKLQPNYVLYWEMIKHACEQGYASYHLGRSTVDSGGEQFKKKWNADSKQLYWTYYLNKTDAMPQLNVNNPKFQLAIRLWQKLPLHVTTILGPLLARSIP